MELIPLNFDLILILTCIGIFKLAAVVNDLARLAFEARE